MFKKALSVFAYLAVMFTLGFAIYYFFLNPNSKFNNPSEHYSQLSSKALFEANLPNENGVNQALKQYQGKVIVLNFWATWCPPCREEMPELSQLHTEWQSKNVVVLGIAIDEVSLVKDFTNETPVSYPLFASEDNGMAISSALGNDKGVLPYTLIINSDGSIVKTYFGRISKTLLETDLKPLFAQ